MKDLRIASFLPAATEMVYALGLKDHLVGVSHECDFPEDAKTKPVLVDCALDLSGLTLRQIDEAVTARIGSGKSLYSVNEEKLRKAAPGLKASVDDAIARALAPRAEDRWPSETSFVDARVRAL